MITEFKTPNGKQLKIVARENKMYFDIKFVGGGEIPPILQGAFTSVPIAKAQIVKYLDQQPFRKANLPEKVIKKTKNAKAS